MLGGATDEAGMALACFGSGPAGLAGRAASRAPMVTRRASSKSAHGGGGVTTACEEAIVHILIDRDERLLDRDRLREGFVPMDDGARLEALDL